MRVVSTSMLGGAMPEPVRRNAEGIVEVDRVLRDGLARGCVHEFYSAESGDATSVAGFVVGLTLLMEAGRTILWLRTQRAQIQGGVLQASGWAELGGAPSGCLFGLVGNDKALLRVAVDALRSASLGAVVVESWGTMRDLDLTASRRLVLAAEKSGVPLLLLRIDAQPMPSAAQTRWRIAAAPSRTLLGHAPGAPAFDIELLRQRGGPTGGPWRVEWDRDRLMFRETAQTGAVVSIPAHRSAAQAGNRDAA